MKCAFTGAEGRGAEKGHHCARVHEARHGLALGGPPPRCPVSGSGRRGEESKGERKVDRRVDGREGRGRGERKTLASK